MTEGPVVAILVLLNNFMHDFSAAGWLFGAVLLWMVRQRGRENGLGAEGQLFVARCTRRLMWFCPAGIVFFGVFRAIAYRQYEWNAAAGDAQVPLLMAKHVLFFLLFFAGLLEFVRAGRLPRGKADETP